MNSSREKHKTEISNKKKATDMGSELNLRIVNVSREILSLPRIEKNYINIRNFTHKIITY